jgi:tRNA nucleotidyltransferase (CCA-adding enzyme)
MKIYLVGGAVRDQLLNLAIKERDWVVVGATVDDMLKQGFRQVGKDFPVFLHPKTNEEYALARKERKIGKGYTGFTFDTSKDVTLEEDLKRRDLTINAIAQSEHDELIDPYHGIADLEKKILRHVSIAFAEDPVRILRVARFAARFAEFGFTIAPETMQLMREMTQAGEVDALVAERVWKELERALVEKNPEKFFEVLASCDAIKILFPAIISINALMNAATLSPDAKIRFAALLHEQTEAQIKALCERYRAPSDYRELALLVSRYFSQYKNAEQLSADDILQVLQGTDAFRREERFRNFLVACQASTSGSQSEFLMTCYNAAKTVDSKQFVHLSGKEISEKITAARREKIQSILNA